MLDVLLRSLAELGPVATWFALYVAAIVAVFVLYVGIALRAVLRATDTEQREIRYQVFRDLLSLFRSRKHS
jgi:hypothetical protein